MNYLTDVLNGACFHGVRAGERLFPFNRDQPILRIALSNFRISRSEKSPRPATVFPEHAVTEIIISQFLPAGRF